jgi:D-aminopeptidase
MKEYFRLLGVEQKVVVNKAHSHNTSIMPKRQQIRVRLCDGKIVFPLNACL